MSAGSDRNRVTLVPGQQYEAGAMQRALFGDGWRDVWVTPVSAPVLDMESFAGGLKFVKRGGGFHSYVLHLQEDDGWKEYRFRSVQKFPQLPDQFKGTLVGKVWQDQVSILFPAAPLMVPPLLDAIGVLHVKPELYVMGDSPRLDVERDSVRGMLGTMELKGSEAPDDKAGFAGSEKVKGTENFMEDIAESRAHRLDEHELLAARLIDFLINDVDRSFDNFDWARFGEKGAYTWRPLPRDRDQAFVDSRGIINNLVVRKLFPKQIPFGPTYDLRGLTYTSYPIDRRLLQRLDADDFRSVALRVQRAVTDDVIGQVIAEMPAEWRARTDADERISAALKARRDALPTVAMAFYQQLSGEVDVFGTEEGDRFDVVRHADGRVTVTITDPERGPTIVRRADGSVITTSAGGIANRDAFYSRTFLPSETKEVRLYANGGDDIAVVRGAAVGDIVVRVIGGEGNDTLADSAGMGTHLYDAEGTNQLLTSGGTHIDTRPWKPLEREEGFRWDTDWRPDWGGTKGLSPVFDYNTGSGLIVGVGHRTRQYGFRRLPHLWEFGASFLVGTGDGRLGVNGYADYRFENSPRAFRVTGSATQLEATRFFGFGNNTAEVSRDLSLVQQQMVTLEPSLVHLIGWRTREGTGSAIKGRDTTRYSGVRSLVGEVRVGPKLAWIDPDPAPGSPLLVSGVRGSESFGLAGAQMALELDRTDDDAVPTSGWTAEAEVAAFPALLGLDDAFGTASAGGSLYVPLGSLGGPHLAFRAGGAVGAGDMPAQFAPAIGGRSSLRGYSWRRYAGDAAVNGGAEFRVPVGTVNFMVRSQLGVFALADAGRVWFDGANDGGWHTGVGGGIWLAALGRSLSIAYANGEGGRLYLKSGMFF